MDNICCICYEKLEFRKAKIDCKHEFCPDCITSWSDYSNNCPLCKNKFKNIDLNINNKNVQFKNIKSKKFGEIFNFEMNNGTLVNSNDYCYICKKFTDIDFMVVCNKCNLKCCHIYCFEKPLNYFPDDDWFCDYCIEYYDIKNYTIRANYFHKISNDNEIDEDDINLKSIFNNYL